MKGEHEKLIVDYLDGRASDEEIGRLDELARTDEGFRRSLLLESTMDTQLRQTLGGTALEAVPVGGASVGRRRWSRLVVAALLAVAAVGWAMAVYLHRQSRTDRGRVADLQTEVEELTATVQARDDEEEPAEDSTRAAEAEPASPEIIDTRGLVLLLPEGAGEKARSMPAGSAVPEGRTLWTCPWGGAGTRYADGTKVSLRRSTTAAFDHSGGARHIRLRGGVLSVERYPREPNGQPAIVVAPGAEIALRRGLVTVVATKERTVVEVGSGSAEVRRASDGQTITLRAGYSG